MVELEGGGSDLKAREGFLETRTLHGMHSLIKLLPPSTLAAVPKATALIVQGYFPGSLLL